MEKFTVEETKEKSSLNIRKQQGLAERIKQYKWHKLLGIEVTNSHKH
jgi:hypothetical protein